jgi:hypothetical protein
MARPQTAREPRLVLRQRGCRPIRWQISDQSHCRRGPPLCRRASGESEGRPELGFVDECQLSGLLGRRVTAPVVDRVAIGRGVLAVRTHTRARSAAREDLPDLCDVRFFAFSRIGF